MNAFLSILARLAARLAMLAGNCIVWSMAFNLMDRCHQIKLLVQVMILSTLSSQKLERGNMSLGNLNLQKKVVNFDFYKLVISFQSCFC